jgi:hypothetical protein
MKILTKLKTFFECFTLENCLSYIFAGSMLAITIIFCSGIFWITYHFCKWILS